MASVRRYLKLKGSINTMIKWKNGDILELTDLHTDQNLALNYEILNDYKYFKIVSCDAKKIGVNYLKVVDYESGSYVGLFPSIYFVKVSKEEADSRLKKDKLKSNITDWLG